MANKEVQSTLSPATETVEIFVNSLEKRRIKIE